ncbi:glycosyltransferase [Altericista sp. CCNU0014]|uniref:glycosyltransferase n=1 Tax=Altericista sp. CCNU0014 TaxID=3082949 RepID=UPI00384E2FCF
MEERESPLFLIEQRYLLVSGIICHCDSEGYRYFDLLWYKDLVEHFRYLKNFTLASPCLYQSPPSDWVKIDVADLELSNIEFIDLPVSRHLLEAIVHLPQTASVLWRAIERSDIVHAGIVGFPFPFSWLVTPSVYFWKKFYIIVVESAPWRLYPGMTASLKDRLRAGIFEWLGRWCLRNANLAIFTQEEYLKSFLDRNDRKGYVIPASWIDDSNIVSNEAASQIWNDKIDNFKFLKIIFAGRLTANKGIRPLLEALTLLDRNRVSIQLDIFGQGELLEECEALKEILNHSVQINLLGTIAYGSGFFETVSQYHAAIVPSLSDEQPRIVFDAYSQAVPVVASDTPGLRSCVRHQRTGILIQPNDAIALADALRDVSQDLGQLRSMGLEALQEARQMSHRTMHQKRWQLLAEFLRS